MRKVIVQEHTSKNPLQLMGEEAGICWGADTSNAVKNRKRGLECLKSGHGRVSEFPQVYLEIKGYSARVIREFYTHIGGGPTRLQASTRYINYNDFEFIVPPSIEKDGAAKVKYVALMRHIQKELSDLASNYDIPREDVANGLPLGMTSDIVVRTNARNLIDMSHQRLCTRAYWEYRLLMRDIMKALSDYSPEWAEIIELEFKPKCEVYGFCNESETRTCGRKSRKNNLN